MAQLRSDHVNYLIWRYLQETGFGKTAIQLQRDWSNNDPESLPFSRDVAQHTLISMIQDAHNYDDLLTSIQTSGTQSPSAPTYQKRYTFVVDRKRPAEDEPQDTRSLLQEIASGSRKRQKLDRPPNEQQQTTASRPSSGRRKSAKVTPLNLQPNGDSMDTDNGEDTNEPEVEDEAQEELDIAIPIATLDIGTSIGTQKEEPADKKLAETVFDIDVDGADILSCHWSSTNPLKCTFTGGSIWQSVTLPETTLSKDSEDEETLLKQSVFLHQGPEKSDFFVSAADDGSVDNTTDSSSHNLEAKAYAWAYTGSEQEQEDGVIVFEKGMRSTIIGRTVNTILFVRINYGSTLLLAGSASEEGQGLIRVYNLEDFRESQQINSNVAAASRLSMTLLLPQIALNAAFSRSETIVTCGESFILTFEMPEKRASDSTPPKLFDIQSSAMNTTHTWELLAERDAIDSYMACGAPDSGYLGLLSLHDKSFNSKQAHDQQVTSILWQPRSPSASDLDKQLLGSSSTDGTVKLWAAEDALECMHILRMDTWVPAMALTFNLSGQYIAAAGAKQIKVWNVEDRTKFMTIANGEDGRRNDDDKLLVAHWHADEEDHDDDQEEQTQPNDVHMHDTEYASAGMEEPKDTTDRSQPPAEPAQHTEPKAHTQQEILHDEMQIDARSRSQTPEPKFEVAPATQTNGTKSPHSENNHDAATNAESHSKVAPIVIDSLTHDHGESEDAAPPFHTLSFNSQSNLLSYTHGSKIHIINIAAQCSNPPALPSPLPDSPAHAADEKEANPTSRNTTPTAVAHETPVPAAG